MIFEAPQIIYVVISVFCMGVIASKLGQPRNDSYGWIDLLIAPAITYGLLIWGGFFG